ncbi:MAG: MerR family transcriptional regulator [Bacteroidota bacterium]
MDPKVPVYSIGTVSGLTGFTPRQLRYYESIGLLSPARSGGRHRHYSPTDVDRLLALRGLLTEGMTLSGARKVLMGMVEVPPRLVEKTSVPILDHTALAESLRQGKSLTSLFPVNDQESLYRLLERIRGEEPDR